MKKTLIALAAAATLALATVAVPSSADARCRGGCVGAAVGLGILGGAIIGSAIANNPPPPPAYYHDGPPPSATYYDEPECRLVKRRVWVEGYGYRTQRVEVCD
jgi:hypothetical protein